MSREVDWRVRDGFKPTRTFQVGELVKYGNHPNAEIVEVHEEGAMYSVRCFGAKTEYGKYVEYEHVQNDVAWYSLQKLNVERTSSFTKPQAFYMQLSNRDISGLMSMVLSSYAGVDFTPEYQRDYVWSEEDKVNLIDSIFNNVTIGLFVFAKVPFKADAKSYEVIDGKQRLTALVEFFEDRFKYNGLYFSEMSFRDQNHFENYGVSIGTLEKPSEKEKYAAFLAVNTTGKVMDKAHLAEVQKRYEEM